MSSPIQNLIGVGAAGAAPVVNPNGGVRPTVSATQLNNPAIQQIIATQAAQIVTQPGKNRITDDRGVVDPSFDSEEKEAKEEEGTEEQKITAKPKHEGSLDVVA